MRNSYCKGKKNRLQPQTMTKSNASFNAREWAVELLIPSSAWPHQGGLTSRKRLSTVPTFNARGWAVDRWFHQVSHLIKKGLPGRKDCPWHLLLMLGDRLWTADSNKCTIPPSQPPHQGGPTWQNRLRDYLAE
jgi:hypothetical protein